MKDLNCGLLIVRVNPPAGWVSLGFYLYSISPALYQYSDSFFLELGLELISSGGKSTENLYSSTSTVTLLKYYSITSKSTGVRKILK